MSRRISTKKRFPQKDLKYGSFLISLFVNRLLKNGKKSIAKKILYTALQTIEEKIKINPILILEKAIKNASPRVFLKSKYLGEKSYKIPALLNRFKSAALAIKWIIFFARKRKKKSMKINLSQELMEAFKGFGNAVKRKEETHKAAESSRVFLSLFKKN
jgi:small subunit ribosomal protein S7